jgi:VWFA-related protein
MVTMHKAIWRRTIRRGTIRRRTIRRILTSLFVFAALAQPPAALAPPHRADSRLIEINVVVRDKSGPVEGLAQTEFKLFDKGKEQKLAYFRMNSRKQAPPAPTLAENLYSNRPDLHKGGRDSVTAVLLDGLNTGPGSQAQARKEVLHFMAGLRPDEAVSVYALGTGLRTLREAGAPWTESRATADLEKWAFESSTAGAMDLQARLRITASALAVIANHIGALPGRKSLVWIAGSFPFTAEHYLASGPPGWGAQAINELSQSTLGMNRPSENPAGVDRMFFEREAARGLQAMNFAGVALYPVDAAGLAGTSTGSSVVSRRTAASGASTAAGDSASQALRVLSEETGGRTFQFSNELEKAVRSAVDDCEVTYTLGFFPDPKSFDSKYHDVKVQAERKDLELRYRKGYVATRDLVFTDAQRAEEYRDATTSPLPSAAIGLMGGWENGPKPGTIHATALLTAADVAMLQKGNIWTGDIEIVFSLRSVDGKELQSVRQGLTLKLDAAKYQAVMEQGVSIEKTLDSSPAAAEVRVVVVDKATGKAGSLSMPVKL